MAARREAQREDRFVDLTAPVPETFPPTRPRDLDFNDSGSIWQVVFRATEAGDQKVSGTWLTVNEDTEGEWPLGCHGKRQVQPDLIDPLPRACRVQRLTPPEKAADVRPHVQLRRRPARVPGPGARHPAVRPKPAWAAPQEGSPETSSAVRGLNSLRKLRLWRQQGPGRATGHVEHHSNPSSR